MERRIVIAAPVRTAIGKATSRDGVFIEVPAKDLLRECFLRVIERSGLESALIDDVIVGTCFTSYDAPNVARVAALLAGFPVEITGYCVQRNCASGFQAVIDAMLAIRGGDGEIYIAGGTESMSRYPYALPPEARWGLQMRDAVLIDTMWRGLTDPIFNEHMGETAERVAEKYHVSRGEQDIFAALSHKKALIAQREGRFKAQIIPVKAKGRVILQDQCPRPNTTGEVLSTLDPAFKKEGGTVTAGNSCLPADGAAAMLLMTEEKAKELNIEPMAEVVAYARSGVDPRFMGEAPIGAILELLAKVRMNVQDIDFFEINEAFAAQCFACQRELGILDEKLNAWGGAIAFGHPVGATGAILIVKAAYILKAYDREYAVVSACVGGGQGVAMLIRNWRG